MHNFVARRVAQRVAAPVLATVLAACGGPNVIANPGRTDPPPSLTLVAGAVAEPGWDSVIAAFNDSDAGREVEVATSYGASAHQIRGVADGDPADVVGFSAEPDITRLVEAGKVSADWDADVTKGIPFGSVVTLVVHKGNPKRIRDWNDLLAPGLEVVTPSPLSSGSAKWNLLAVYAAASGDGRDRRAGLEFLDALIGDHVKLRPDSGREATAAFVDGGGDVLLSSESEALAAERQGKPVEHVTPPSTVKVEYPMAVVTTSRHLKAATAFKNFQYTTQAQRRWAEAGFRPVDPQVAAEFARRFPAPKRLVTVGELGGWETVNPQLFEKNTGAITRIYARAAG